MNKRLLSLMFLSALVFSSCAKLEYLDQALTLKAYSDDRDAIAVDIARRDGLFDKLVERIRAGETLSFLRMPDDLVREFGEPVLVRPARDGSSGEEWLYRHQLDRSEKAPKVYFLIGPDKRLAGWRKQGF